MKKITATIGAVAVLLAAAILLTAAAAVAEEGKMIGVVTKIDLASDGKAATATLKDIRSGEEVTVHVYDDLTLNKFKDKRITPGVEIRLKYEIQGGKKVSTYFRKTAGC